MPNAIFWLLCAFLATLWLAGGASRADVLGQAVVRAAAWGALIGAGLLGMRPRLRSVRPVLLLLLALLALVSVQLMPLPPSLWQALPGRALLADAARTAGENQPWRPLAMVPGATYNTLFSLVIPCAALLLVAALGEGGHARLPGLLLGLVAASTFVGLLQFSGGWFDNPLVNDSSDQVSGNFANRNHFATFQALGLLLAPPWAVGNDRQRRWRAPVAFGLVILFALTILASGSRAGLLLGTLALGLGLLLARRGIGRALRHAPRWAASALLLTLAAGVGGAILLSVAADRAISIQRAIAVDAQLDMRARALPSVLELVRAYWPTGSGFGGFDRVFAQREPLTLLAPTYFNHAHNDYLEVALDGGLAGVVLLAAAIGWWLWASARTWRRNSGGERARLGSAMLLLVAVASLFDYPARTPLIMAVMTIAAVWLSGGSGRGEPALPRGNQLL